jgi:hypothetical protein
MPYPQREGVMDAKYLSVYAANADEINSTLNIREASVKFVALYQIG